MRYYVLAVVGIVAIATVGILFGAIGGIVLWRRRRRSDRARLASQ